MTKHFATRKEALAFLSANALHCVTWPENGHTMSAIYWSGKRRIQLAAAKINWSTVETLP